MARSVVHVVGAGLAGLAAAVRLAKESRAVVVHEAATQAGGRCRSYFDATMGMRIDNGNHIILSGNRAALDYLRTIGGAGGLTGPKHAQFDFIDLATKERWSLKPSGGLIPWWIFDVCRRGPASAGAFLSAFGLAWSKKDEPVARRMACRGPAYERLWRPLLLAALNTDPAEASARLAGAVLRESLMKGGWSCRPLVATDGLSEAFIDPAVRYLESRGGKVLYGRRLKAIRFEPERVVSLDFDNEAIALGGEDRVILAVPSWVATSLVPELVAPVEQRAIVNAHFRITPPPELKTILGIVNGTSEWVFAFPGRIAITISAADRLIDVGRDELARQLWNELGEATGMGGPMPAWQIIKERRATFAAKPIENARRPGSATRWHNLALAGDWTQTGLPATIEGAVRSGQRAAEQWTKGG
jgi:squalene-associated FAD-dependent desaturase